MSGAFDYSERVRALFNEPAHAGTVAGPTVELARGSMQVELGAELAEGRVTTLRFRAFGCPHLLAAAEYFCEAFEGRPVTDLGQYAASQVIARLGIPLEKSGQILLLEDAITALREKIAASQNLEL